MANIKKAATKTKKQSPKTKQSIKSKSKAIQKSTAAKRKSKVSFIPKGYHSVTPYLIVKDANKAIEYYQKTFGAKEVMRMDKPDGKIGHAELKIGDAKIMLSDVCQESNTCSSHSHGESLIGIHLYIKDVDAIIEQAIAAGAKVRRPVETMFYGDRIGIIEDPFGIVWSVSTHIEDVTPKEMKKRAAKLFAAS